MSQQVPGHKSNFELLEVWHIQMHFLNENVEILTEISPNLIHKDPNDNNSAFGYLGNVLVIDMVAS